MTYCSDHYGGEENRYRQTPGSFARIPAIRHRYAGAGFVVFRCEARCPGEGLKN